MKFRKEDEMRVMQCNAMQSVPETVDAWEMRRPKADLGG